MTTTPPASTRRPFAGRLLALGLVAVFAGPIGVAWWLNLHPPTSYSEIEITGKGSRIIRGAPILSEDGLTPLEGEPPASGYFQGKWTLLMVNETLACTLTCTDALLMTRQVRHALGREMGRLHRVLVQTQALDERSRRRMRAYVQSAGGVIAAMAPPAWSGHLVKVLHDGDRLGGSVFVLDPLGQLVLYYRVEDEPKGLMKDMKRLLRLSKIG